MTLRGPVAARFAYAGLTLGVIALGLVVHRPGGGLPPALRDKLGDALWASMVFGGIGVAAPMAPLPGRAVAALGFSFAVELSQLYHAPALDALRRTTLGHLVLGSGFDPADLCAYLVGVLGAALLDAAVRRRRAPATRNGALRRAQREGRQ